MTSISLFHPWYLFILYGIYAIKNVKSIQIHNCLKYFVIMFVYVQRYSRATRAVLCN